jgi:3-oxoacyl-[acyl-carrier-protein] synthase II
MSTEAFLVGGVRTPFGRFRGALADARPDDLAALAVGAALERAGVAPDAVDEVILGAANQAGEDNRNVARMAVLLAGLPDDVPGYTVNRLCASSLQAVASAAQQVRAGEADVVVAGGGDAGINLAMFSGLSNMGPLSERNDDPAGASRPFDSDRDGFVFGEGAVALVLESAEHAEARGAEPYGRVAGGALTADAFHMSAPEPSGRYASLAIELALQRAGIAPDQLGYICAHGTGTRANDSSESKAIRAVLGAKLADSVPVSSPKSMVGHLIGAAGSLAAMVCLLSIRDGVVPPTINLDNPDPDCDLDHVANVARETPVEAAIANAFGFGGQNCVVAVTAP